MTFIMWIMIACEVWVRFITLVMSQAEKRCHVLSISIIVQIQKHKLILNYETFNENINCGNISPRLLLGSLFSFIVHLSTSSVFPPKNILVTLHSKSRKYHWHAVIYLQHINECLVNTGLHSYRKVTWSKLVQALRHFASWYDFKCYWHWALKSDDLIIVV